MRALVLVLLLTPLAAACYHQVQVDDPYITYRYARNLAAGHGLVYSPGEPVLGTTAPLHALVLALGGQVTDDYPLLSSLLSGLALGALSLLVYRFMALVGEARAGRIAALLVLLNPLLGDALGFELNLFLALIFGAFCAYFGGHPNVAAVLLGLGALTRGDGMVAAALLLAWDVRAHRRVPWIPVLIWGAILAAWTAYAYWYFGAAAPNPLAAKRAMGASQLWRPLWLGGLRVASLYLEQSLFFVWFAVVAVVGGTRLRAVDRRLWPLLVSPVLVLGAYQAMGIPSAYNYYAALVPSLMILGALGVVHLAESAGDRWPGWRRRRGVVRAALVLPLLVAEVTPTVERVRSHPEPRYWTYRRAGEWLAANTPENASVGLVEIGIVGYYSRRRVVDVCGLVSPAVGPHLAAGDVSWPIRHYRPDYVLLHDPVWASLEEPVARAEWFGEEYERVRGFDGAVPYRLALYQRRSGRTAEPALPEPVP